MITPLVDTLGTIEDLYDPIMKQQDDNKPAARYANGMATLRGE